MMLAMTSISSRKTPLALVEGKAKDFDKEFIKIPRNMLHGGVGQEA
jgi:hypothetical protein